MNTITFFSYKGGAGRSTLAYNTIPILANEYYKPTKESPMIVIDMDIDSCGMSYLLGADKHVTPENSIQSFLRDSKLARVRASSIQEHPLLSTLCPVGNAYGYHDNDAILLFPAMDGQLIDENTQSNYSDNGNPYAEAFRSFQKLCKEQFNVPAIILDSAVGNNATANISNAAANTIVCCMRPTTQFTNGTYRYLYGLENDELNGVSIQKKTFRNKDIILVPNVIPQNQITINGKYYPDAAITKIRSDFKYFDDEDLANKYHFEMLEHDEFGIPAVDKFMWCEDVLYNQDKSTLNVNEKTALERYHKLAKLIYSMKK